MRPKIPVIKRTLPLGNKRCNNCKTNYNHYDIKAQGLLYQGLYWINCENCANTLVVREDYFETKGKSKDGLQPD